MALPLQPCLRRALGLAVVATSLTVHPALAQPSSSVGPDPRPADRDAQRAASAQAGLVAGPNPTPALTRGPVHAPVAATHGLYPLWEQTGSLLPSGSYEIGYAHAAVAFGPVQVGTNPYLDVYGTANAALKLRIWQGPRVRAALATAVYRVPTRAESRALGNLDAPGFSNPYGPVWLVPTSVAFSVAPSRRTAVHAATTALVVLGERDQQRHVSVGEALMAEARPSPSSPWAARLHVGLEGLGVQAQAHAGVSFGYVGEVVRLSAGAARKFMFEGQQSTVLMADAALVFP